MNNRSNPVASQRQGPTLNSVGTENSDNEKFQYQQGSGFLSFLYGDDNETDANMTELILCALEKGKIEVVDFLLEKKFQPDLTVVTKNGDNLAHLLTKAVDKSNNIRKALFQLVTNTNFNSLLNKPNNQGDTPLHIAVKNRLHDFVNLMIANGATRTFNNENYGIVTDRDEDETNNDRHIPVTIIKTTQLQQPKRHENNTKSIFTKQHNNNNNSVSTLNNDLIAEIVRAFKTASDSDTIRDITRTEIPDFFSTKQRRSEPRGSEPVRSEPRMSEPRRSEPKRSEPVRSEQKNPEPMNPIENLDSAMDSDMFVQHIAKKIMGDRMQMGGVKKKSKSKKVTGKRKMITFSELSDQNELFGGMSDDDVLKKISRAQTNQKDKLHELAEEKILNLLPKKDSILAKAVKSIIYNEIKTNKPQLNGLDRADELNKVITQKRVDEVLSQKDKIKERVEQIEKNTKERNAKINANTKETKEKGIKFESSASDSDDSDSDSDSDDINTSDEPYRKQKK